MRDYHQGQRLRQAVQGEVAHKGTPDFAALYSRRAHRTKRRATWALLGTSLLSGALLIQPAAPPPLFDRQVEVFVAGLWEE